MSTNRPYELQKSIADKLRGEPTKTEELLWAHLRNRRLEHCKFRRQHPIDRFWVDFCCDELKLIVEVDGQVHNCKEQRDADQARQAYLEALSYRVVRIRAEDLINDIWRVLDYLRQTIRLRREELRPPEYQMDGG